MRIFFPLTTFFLTNFVIVLTAVALLSSQVGNYKRAGQVLGANSETVITSSYDFYTVLPAESFNTQAEIVAGDARGKIVDNFFAHYNSPMLGLGADIIRAEDEYNLPFGLLPAIAMCEGNLGKVIPFESHNTWGYGINSAGTLRFSTWQEGIEAVSKGLRRDYFNHGLTTPESIMKKYTPHSNGSWAFCVNKFLEELK